MEVGQVESNFDREGYFMWYMREYVPNVLLSGPGLKSPRFRFSGIEYYIRVRYDEAKNLCIVSFSQFDDSPPQGLFVKIKQYFRGNLEKRRARVYDKNIDFDLVDWLDASTTVLMEKHRHSSWNGGVFTVVCELMKLDEEEKLPMVQEKIPSEKVREENEDSETDSGVKETDSEYNTLKALQRDFENLFKSGEDCDVTLKVQNKEFPAHSIILRARSPVFKSMFSHETLEKLSGVVVIDDCYPETFPDFLNYLYSGSIKHVNEKNVCHLFTASDKYQVEELKKECAKFMKSHLSVENFCDFITLALMHTEEELIDSATKFFCANVVEIAKTAKWQIFLKENLTVGNELFLKSLAK